MVMDLIHEGTLMLADCPPHAWDGLIYEDWVQQNQIVQRECALSMVHEFGNLGLDLLSRSKGLGDTASGLLELCSARVEEFQIKDEKDMDEYILYDLMKFQLHPFGLENYRR